MGDCSLVYEILSNSWSSCVDFIAARGQLVVVQPFILLCNFRINLLKKAPRSHQ